MCACVCDVCVSVCVRACVRAYVCACVCVCPRVCESMHGACSSRNDSYAFQSQQHYLNSFVMVWDENCCCCETHTHTNTLIYLDVNECATNNGGCDRKRKCTNTVGGIYGTCGDCPAGYENDGPKGCKGVCVRMFFPRPMFKPKPV